MEAGKGRSVVQYYRSPRVRERIAQYCGLGEGSDSRCTFVCGLFPGSETSIADWGSAPRYAVGDLGRLFEIGADISRSLWETAGLLVCVDIDYQNADQPAEAFTHPVETFFKLEKTFQATRSILRELSIPHLSLMTGEGYHFTAHIRAQDPVFRDLADLAGRVPPWWKDHEARLPAWMRERMDERMARAYHGLGMVLEHLAHRILRRTASGPIPVVLNGTPVGTGLVGRECISVDLSAAGDPLEQRHCRVAFGAYQKHRFRPDLMSARVSAEVPALVALPRNEADDWLDLVGGGRGTEQALELAASRCATPPEAGEGMARLLAAYRADPLASCHRDFYSLPLTGDEVRVDLDTLPPCVRSCLENPNDLLLMPGFLQNLTRTLMARGWHPRRIAALVRSRYEQDFGWGTRWTQMHAETHADFYVRAFAGLVRCGVDRMVDFNCTSNKEKGMCPGGVCGQDLRVERARLVAGVA